jgi:excisionase family DNA binding protein
MNKPKLLTPGQTARLLGVSPITVRNWARKGLLPANVTAGGHRRFEHAAVMTFAQSRNMLIFPLEERDTRILVVEDDQQFAAFVVEVLRTIDSSAEIIIACDGFDAGRKIQSFVPDIVLLDLMLPGIDGFSLCNNLKSDPLTQRIRVIAMSGYAKEQNIERILSAGAETCLEKPFSRADILKALLA